MKREELKEKTKTTFLGNKCHTDYAYRIEVENYKKEKKTITLIDQIPVSKLAEIKVKLVKVSEEPMEKDELGILKWKFALEPKQKKVIEFEFFIEHPKDLRIIK